MKRAMPILNAGVTVTLLLLACSDDEPTAPPTSEPASLVVAPAQDTLNAIGDSLELGATVYDASQEEMPGASITWSNLDPAIATVGESGRVVSVAVGSARIRAASGELADTAVVIVRQVADDIVVNPGADTLSVGGTLQLAASVADSNDVEVDGASVDWSSTDPAVASVDGSGEVTAAGLGTTQVVATYEGASDTAEVTVYDQVAFRTTRDGNSEIYIVNADGTNAVNLSMDGGNDTDPVWSPDGSRLAFVSDRDGNDEVYVVNADGTDPVNVSNDGGFDDAPTWSPDGSRLAFQSFRDGDWEIFVVDADGSNVQQLTYNDDQDSDPDWSPVDDRITFRSDSLGNPEIAVVRADGTGLDFLTDDIGADYNPVWSPDGARIAFRSNRTGNFDVFLMDEDGTNVENITTHGGNDSNATWSPDGGMIAFTRDWNIYVVDADGTDEVQLTHDAANNSRPTWSPDGTRIAFESSGDGDYEIYSITLDGTVTVNLTDDSGADTRAAWRP